MSVATWAVTMRKLLDQQCDPDSPIVGKVAREFKGLLDPRKTWRELFCEINLGHALGGSHQAADRTANADMAAADGEDALSVATQAAFSNAPTPGTSDEWAKRHGNGKAH